MCVVKIDNLVELIGAIENFLESLLLLCFFLNKLCRKTFPGTFMILSGCMSDVESKSFFTDINDGINK